MPKRLYLDSNVFISFVREEIDSAFNLRYLESRNFFAFCAKQKHVLIISGWFLDEVKTIIFLNMEAVFEEFQRMGVKTIFVNKAVSGQLVSEISRNCNLHRGDAIHVAIALENKADFIVTWNEKDFDKARSYIVSVSPSGILDIP